jgi:hypothetical protein
MALARSMHDMPPTRTWKEHHVHKTIAKRILSAINAVSKSQMLLQIEQLKKNDPTWEHHWIRGKPNILGGVRTRRSLPKQSEQLDTLTLVFMQWYPHDQNYYLIVLDDRAPQSTLAEIYRTKVIDSITYLKWKYIPKKGDKRNHERKAYFAEIYPDAAVEIPAVQAERDSLGFISEIYELAQVKINSNQCMPTDPTDNAIADEEVCALEGEQRRLYVLHRTRERRLRARKIEDVLQRSGGRLVCEVPGCEFDFGEIYGELGEGFAHVHHLKPLSSAGKGMHVKLSELAIVCANCHAMIHRGGECRPPKDLIEVRRVSLSRS